VTESPADVEQARARDPDAFRRLFMATADRTHRLARWMLGTSDVDDVVQDIYFRAWERLPHLREPHAFGGWLRQLAVNVVLRHRQRRSRRDSGEDDLALADSMATRDASPGLRLDLERAVARLPAQARHVFVLYDVEGYRHHEIAGLLGIGEGTSRSQLHRARSLMKQLINEGDEP
jgi:RNA polymerase sigma-70 factor (ECF subfamily)